MFASICCLIASTSVSTNVYSCMQCNRKPYALCSCSYLMFPQVWDGRVEGGLWKSLSENLDTFVRLRGTSQLDKWKAENILRHWMSLGVFGSLGVDADAGNVDQSALAQAFDEGEGKGKGEGKVRQHEREGKGEVGQHKLKGKASGLITSGTVLLRPKAMTMIRAKARPKADDADTRGPRGVPPHLLQAAALRSGKTNSGTQSPRPLPRPPPPPPPPPPAPPSPQRWPSRSRSPRRSSPHSLPSPPSGPDWSADEGEKQGREDFREEKTGKEGEEEGERHQEEEEEEDSIPGWCPNCKCWRRQCFRIGDWLCSECGNHNYASKAECTNFLRCPAHRRARIGTGSSGVGALASAAASSSSSSSAPPAASSAPLAASSAAGDSPMVYMPIGWCKGCAKPRVGCFKPFDWACPTCGNHNWARKQVRISESPIVQCIGPLCIRVNCVCWLAALDRPNWISQTS